jgi:hypothetical protein
MEENYLIKTNCINEKIKNIEKDIEKIIKSSEVGLKNTKKSNLEAFEFFENKKKDFRKSKNLFIK